MRLWIEPGSPRTTAPSTSGELVVERPPPGLARGKYAASPWAIGSIGVGALLLTVGYFLLRWRRHRSP